MSRAAERSPAVVEILEQPISELADLRDWLATFLWFVRLFNRAIGLVPVLEPTELERLLDLLARIPDATILRLVRLLGQVPDDDVMALVTGLSKLSPTAARRSIKLMAGVVKTVSRWAAMEPWPARPGPLLRPASRLMR